RRRPARPRWLQRCNLTERSRQRVLRSGRQRQPSYLVSWSRRLLFGITPVRTIKRLSDGYDTPGRYRSFPDSDGSPREGARRIRYRQRMRSKRPAAVQGGGQTDLQGPAREEDPET